MCKLFDKFHVCPDLVKYLPVLVPKQVCHVALAVLICHHNPGCL